jgi:hypothetical protein
MDAKEPAMTIQGHVRGGIIVLDAAAQLPEGAAVEVRILPSPSVARRANPDLLKYAGMADDLPPEASQTIDQVLYGTPRK